MTYEEKYKIINSILKDRELIFTKVEYKKFIEAVIKADNIAKYLNISATALSNLNKKLFPNKTKGKLLNYILSLGGMKHCRNCDSYLNKNLFRPNKRNADGLNSYCKKCQSKQTAKTQPSRQAKYLASKLERTPPWADFNKIKEIYDNCPQGYHVDHIIPLQGKLISGLHVEYNLQYLPARENCSKGNRIDLDTINIKV